jgi:hypothetical protein
VAPGRPGAKVLLTNLINYAQPLIRYELTDSVVESPLPNPAGRPWRCLLSVDGRTADHPVSPRTGWRDRPRAPIGARISGRSACRGWRVCLCVRRAWPTCTYCADSRSCGRCRRTAANSPD